MVLFIYIVKTIYKDDQNKNNFINKTYRGKKYFPVVSMLIKAKS